MHESAISFYCVYAVKGENSNIGNTNISSVGSTITGAISTLSNNCMYTRLCEITSDGTKSFATALSEAWVAMGQTASRFRTYVMEIYKGSGDYYHLPATRVGSGRLIFSEVLTTGSGTGADSYYVQSSGMWYQSTPTGQSDKSNTLLPNNSTIRIFARSL